MKNLAMRRMRKDYDKRMILVSEIEKHNKTFEFDHIKKLNLVELESLLDLIDTKNYKANIIEFGITNTELIQKITDKTTNFHTNHLYYMCRGELEYLLALLIA